MTRSSLWLRALIASLGVSPSLAFQDAVVLGDPVLIVGEGDPTPDGGIWHLAPNGGVDSEGQVILMGGDRTTFVTPTLAEPVEFIDGRELGRFGDPVWGSMPHCIASFQLPRRIGGLSWHLSILWDGSSGVCQFPPPGATIGTHWIMQGGMPIVGYGSPTQNPRFPAGSTYEWSLGPYKAASTRRVLVKPRVQLPGAPSTIECLVEFQTDGLGTRTGERVIFCEGDVLPALAPQPFYDIVWFDQASDGRVAAILSYVDASGTPAQGLYVDGSVVLRLGDPLPELNTTVGPMARCEVNARGDWLVTFTYQPPGPVHLPLPSAVIRNGELFYSQLDIPPHYAGLELRSAWYPSLADSGRSAFIAVWSLPNSSAAFEAPLIIDGSIVLDRGRTVLPGIPGPSGGAGVHYDDPLLDPDGAYLSFVNSTQTPTGYVGQLVGFPLDRAEPACRAAVASTGLWPRTALFGTTRRAGEGLALRTTDLPPSTFAVYLASDRTTFLPAPLGAFGALCIGSPLWRSGVRLVEPTGRLDLDVEVLTAANPPQPGDRWWFQAIYRDRDPMTGSATVRYADAVSIEFN